MIKIKLDKYFFNILFPNDREKKNTGFLALELIQLHGLNDCKAAQK